MKLLTIFLFLVPPFLFGQIQSDSINGEKMYNLKELSLIDTPDSVSFPFYQIDTLTQTPINGWVKTKSEKSITFEHYKNGLSNGRYVKYELINNRLKKTYECLRHQGWTYESYDFKWKNDSINLTKIFYKKWTDDYHLSREIKIKTNKYKMKDAYYFYESLKKKKMSYKLDSINHFMSDLRGAYFPNELNEIENPFVNVRFDGYYVRRVRAMKNGTTLQIDSTFSYDVNIRFYTDGSFRQVEVKLTEKLTDWDSKDVVVGEYWLEGNNVRFHYEKTNFTLVKAEFYNGYNLIEFKFYSKGGIKRSVFDFIKD